MLSLMLSTLECATVVGLSMGCDGSTSMSIVGHFAMNMRRPSSLYMISSGSRII